MTVPCSLPVVAAPALVDSPTAAPGASDATQDAFAAVLAALSGALGVPLVQLPAQPVATESAATTAEEPSGAEVQAAGAPGAWVAATQRQAVPGIVPAKSGATGAATVQGTVATGVPEETTPGEATRQGAPAKALAAEAGPVGPAHATHGTEVRATRPAGEHAPFARLDAPDRDPSTPAPAVDAEAPAVPAVAPAAPGVADQPPVAATQQVTPTTTPVAAEHTRAEGMGPAKHVQPAVLEAARGLRHEGGGRTSLVVRLDPPELGAVLVRLTVQDGRVDVQLRTPDLVARQDLQSQQYDVQQVLRDQGFDLSSFDVAHGDVFTDQFPGNQGDSPDRGTPQRSRRTDGRMDDHHPVTDDGLAPAPSGTWL